MGGMDDLRASISPLFATRVDQVAVEERAAALARRSVKTEAKRAGLRLALSMLDLTTLEGKDTPGKIAALCRKAIRPLEIEEGTAAAPVPSAAAVCVYPPLVAAAKRCLAGSPVKVAAVAGAFPSGQSPLAVRRAEVRAAVALGADEIDIVLNRNAFLAGDWRRAHDDVSALAEAAGNAALKVILETGELETYDNVRRASMLAMAAGADFVKTSTGKIPRAATPPVVLVMLEAVRDFYYATGRRVGVKAAGGVRTAKQALHYLVLVKETLGDAWLTPDRFRIGASTLANDLLMQIAKEMTGRYQSVDYFSRD
jgi:deoxyribose-phosphate aldolase